MPGLAPAPFLCTFWHSASLLTSLEEARLGLPQWGRCVGEDAVLFSPGPRGGQGAVNTRPATSSGPIQGKGPPEFLLQHMGACFPAEKTKHLSPLPGVPALERAPLCTREGIDLGWPLLYVSNSMLVQS